MQLNWMLIPTLAIALLVAVQGFRLGQSRLRPWHWILGALLALPAVAYSGYYLHLVGEPMYLYRLRAANGSELLASGLGLLAGMLLAALPDRLPTLRQASSLMLVAATVGILSLPYVKPVVRPADWSAFTDERDGIAVMQTTPYSCGPATAATLLNALGSEVTEQQLAREAFTSVGGTENWYLARAIRRHGHAARFAMSDVILVSSIAGVRGAGWGHYIAIVSKQGGTYVVADPLVGALRLSSAELRRRYQFTGFYLVVD